ncbi:unnamed protein product [Rhodiola kirilowii]
MGSICCCPCGDDFDEYAHPNNSIYRHCICFRFFIQQLFSGYSATFHRLDNRSISSPTQGATTMASSGLATILPDNPSNDSHLSLSRLPLPYDAEQRYSRVQRNLVSRREKSNTHFQEDAQPLRRNSSSSGMETLGSGNKWKVNDSEDDEIILSESSEKTSNAKLSYGLTTIQPIEDDEDVCPTCLDDYTPENPKIITRCSHHFHLGCIYEWMERSECCPICGKEMEFCESP